MLLSMINELSLQAQGQMKVRLKAHSIDLEMMPQQMMQHQGIVTTLTQKMLHHLLNHFLSLKILQQAMWSLIEKHLDKFKKTTLQ